MKMVPVLTAVWWNEAESTTNPTPHWELVSTQEPPPGTRVVYSVAWGCLLEVFHRPTDQEKRSPGSMILRYSDETLRKIQQLGANSPLVDIAPFLTFNAADDYTGGARQKIIDAAEPGTLYVRITPVPLCLGNGVDPDIIQRLGNARVLGGYGVTRLGEAFRNNPHGIHYLVIDSVVDTKCRVTAHRLDGTSNASVIEMSRIFERADLGNAIAQGDVGVVVDYIHQRKDHGAEWLVRVAQVLHGMIHLNRVTIEAATGLLMDMEGAMSNVVRTEMFVTFMNNLPYEWRDVTIQTAPYGHITAGNLVDGKLL
jgi:hypothetical protein